MDANQLFNKFFVIDNVKITIDSGYDKKYIFSYECELIPTDLNKIEDSNLFFSTVRTPHNFTIYNPKFDIIQTYINTFKVFGYNEKETNDLMRKLIITKYLSDNGIF